MASERPPEDPATLHARIAGLERELSDARARLAALEPAGDDAAALRALYGEPSVFGARKVLDRLDEHARRFVALSPFVCIGSASIAGAADVSPRGDAPGFVRVLDPHTLAIPDRPGNNRLDTMLNVVGNPSVGLLFLIPGREEVLRVNGSAAISRDATLLASLAAHGKAPRTALRVHVVEAFLHCGKAIKRARLWDPDGFVGAEALPSLGRMLADQIASAELTPEEAERRIAESYRTRLY